MTTVYFIRHAQADNSVRDGRLRPLTEKGMTDRALVTAFLQDKCINAVLSSPYKRAVDTVADFAERNDFEIELVEDSRERKSDSDWLRDTDFWPFIELNRISRSFFIGRICHKMQSPSTKFLRSFFQKATVPSSAV